MINDSSESLLDLRFNGKLSVKSSKLFNKISNDLRSDFNDLTEKIINNNNNIDWWVNGVPSRNTYENPFSLFLLHASCSRQPQSKTIKCEENYR